MRILVKGLKEGKCPNNLQITFGTLDIFDPDRGACRKTNAWALKEALQSLNCPSDLRIEYSEHEQIESLTIESRKSLKELDKLCTNRNYERDNIHRNIYNIYSAIYRELKMELSRLGEKDPVRRGALERLQKNIGTICNKAIESIQTCDRSTTWEWKTSLRADLEKEIKGTLHTGKLDKKHTALEKIAKNLLNIITGMLFPLAVIKYARTGSAFYSTVGKSHEAVEKTLDVTKTIK